MEENNTVDVSENIKNEIKSNDVVLFMKGTPVFPMCGFSAATVQVLSDIKLSSTHVISLLHDIKVICIANNEIIILSFFIFKI